MGMLLRRHRKNDVKQEELKKEQVVEVKEEKKESKKQTVSKSKNTAQKG